MITGETLVYVMFGVAGLATVYSMAVDYVMTRRERRNGTAHRPTLREREARTRHWVNHVTDGLWPILAWELVIKPAVFVSEHAETVSTITHH